MLDQVRNKVLSWVDPELQQTLADLKVKVAITKSQDGLMINISRAYIVVDSQLWLNLLTKWLQVSFDMPVAINVKLIAPAKATVMAKKHPKIANIIAVLSGKGGVGKSTIANNLAVTLVQQGYKVGLLDADIHGPSQVLMLGPNQTETTTSDDLLPATCHGVKVISMGAVLAPGQAAAWRGPMASKALLQLYQEASWPELDFLLVDCPPGTSDILISLAKDIPVIGGVLVTTPQVAAVMDAERAANLMQTLQMPVLGVVENMSQYHCSNCGHKDTIFGADGGEFLANSLAVDFLGSIALDARICDAAENGAPLALSDDIFIPVVAKLTNALLRLPKYNLLNNIDVELK